MSVLIHSPLICTLILWAGWLWVSSLLLFLILPPCSLWQSMLAPFGARWYGIDILAVNILWLYYVEISLSYFPIEFALWANYLSAIWLFVFCSQMVKCILRFCHVAILYFELIQLSFALPFHCDNASIGPGNGLALDRHSVRIFVAVA